MKLRTRSINALACTDYTAASSPAIVMLTEFASAGPRLDYANYGEPKSYRAEARAILNDWRRFKTALNEAAALGVNDAGVIAAAHRAFSGRLEWKSRKAIQSRLTDPAQFGGKHKGGIVKTEVTVWGWEYCTGQYYPTEYRKAAAAVLEQACNSVRQSRPAVRLMPQSISELKERNHQNGSHWFSRDSMRFFGTRIESGVLSGRYFITSEQPPSGGRTFTLRTFNAAGEVDTVGEFAKMDYRSDVAEFLTQCLGQIQRAKEDGAKIHEREDGRWIILDQPKDSRLWKETFDNEWEAACAYSKQLATFTA